MKTSITPISGEDREAVIDIFNYYVENSFAAYPEHKLPYEAFDSFMKLSAGLPSCSVKNEEGMVVGFAMLRLHNNLPVFSKTAEVTYFLHPDYTGKGLGKTLLDYLERSAVAQGMTSILAHISSLNSPSIRFHQKNGFVECGRFVKIGKKNGQEFDTVWMQKML